MLNTSNEYMVVRTATEVIVVHPGQEIPSGEVIWIRETEESAKNLALFEVGTAKLLAQKLFPGKFNY